MDPGRPRDVGRGVGGRLPAVGAGRVALAGGADLGPRARSPAPVTEALKSVFVIVLGIVLVGIACPPLWVFPLTLFEIRSDKPVVEREISVEEEALSTERDWRRQRERASRYRD